MKTAIPGCFWQLLVGHQEIPLDLETGKRSTEDDTLYSLGAGSVNSGLSKPHLTAE